VPIVRPGHKCDSFDALVSTDKGANRMSMRRHTRRAPRRSRDGPPATPTLPPAVQLIVTSDRHQTLVEGRVHPLRDRARRGQRIRQGDRAVQAGDLRRRARGARALSATRLMHGFSARGRAELARSTLPSRELLRASLRQQLASRRLWPTCYLPPFCGQCGFPFDGPPAHCGLLPGPGAAASAADGPEAATRVANKTAANRLLLLMVPSSLLASLSGHAGQRIQLRARPAGINSPLGPDSVQSWPNTGNWRESQDDREAEGLLGRRMAALVAGWVPAKKTPGETGGGVIRAVRVPQSSTPR
jgi:hypothetical protein